MNNPTVSGAYDSSDNKQTTIKALFNGSDDDQQTTIQHILEKIFVVVHEIRMLGETTTGFRITKLSKFGDKQKSTIILYHEHTAAVTTNKQQSSVRISVI